MTYTLINAVFLAAAVLVFLAVERRRFSAYRMRALGVTAAIMVALTIVFDNLMISVGLVDYGEAQISGIRLGVMPIEDLSYTVFALLVLPALWTALAARRHRRREERESASGRRRHRAGGRR